MKLLGTARSLARSASAPRGANAWSAKPLSNAAQAAKPEAARQELAKWKDVNKWWKYVTTKKEKENYEKRIKKKKNKRL